MASHDKRLDGLHRETLAVRLAAERSQYGENSEALYLTSGYVQPSAEDSARRFAGEDETLIGMSISAAEKALAAAGVDAAEVGCVIVATSTHPEHTPASAPQVATALGLTAAAFDISAGCAGFCHALNLAASMVRAGAGFRVSG